MSSWLTLFLLALSTSPSASSNPPGKPKWSYGVFFEDHGIVPSGKENKLNQQTPVKLPHLWSEVSEFCNNDNYMQSPIAISSKLSKPSPLICAPNNDLEWVVKNEPIDFIATNNGHSLSLTAYLKESYTVSQKTMLNKEHNNIAELTNYWNLNQKIDVNEHYCMDSFHFHWSDNDRQGSEHTIDMKQYALEAHFVHFSCDFESLPKALDSWQKYGNSGKDPFVLAVVAVMFEIGEANDALNKIFDKCGELKNAGDKSNVDRVNIHELLPPVGSDYNYYTYEGSLTTPPCTPIVRWHILKDSMTVSEEQLNKLRTLLNGDQKPEAPNFRPLQVNPNTVYKCAAK